MNDIEYILQKYKNNLLEASKSDSSFKYDIIRKISVYENSSLVKELCDTTIYTIHKYYSKLVTSEKETYYFEDIAIELYNDSKQIVLFTKTRYSPANDFCSSLDINELKMLFINNRQLCFYKEIEKCKPPLDCKIKKYYFSRKDCELDSINSIFTKDKYLNNVSILAKKNIVLNDKSSIRNKFLDESNKLVNLYNEFTVKDLRRVKK